MKGKIIIALGFLLLWSCGNPKEQEIFDHTGTVEEPGIEFSEYTHDFGDIHQGEKVAHVFRFTNTGSGALVIKSASTTCGCTVPRFDKKPLPPGKTGRIEVVFDSSGRRGKQTKTIRIHNNTKKKDILLTITANILID